jgi:hypothetical protein
MGRWAILATLAFLSSPAFPGEAAPPAGNPDFTEFYRRLESVGLRTDDVRALTAKLGLHYGFLRGGAGRYGFILNNLYLPPENFKEAGSSRIRFDLEPPQISTLIHELCHAAADLTASADAAKGSAAREHHEAMHAIWGDLRSQAFFYRYAGLKSDEVVAYIMGADIGKLFETANLLVIFNSKLDGLDLSQKPDAMSEQEFLSGKFILPKPDAKIPAAWLENDLNGGRRFGGSRVYDIAEFEGKKIHWEERGFIKDDIYRHVLGLDPPRTVQELVDRLNSIENEWVKGVRREIAAGRAARLTPKAPARVKDISLPDGIGF